MIEFKMPALGADMERGTLTSWHVKPGDRVERGAIVADIDTDKGVIEVEIWHSGVITQLLVQQGQSVPVGTTLALLDSNETTPILSSETISSMPHSLEPSFAKITTPSVSHELRASPLARKIALDHGIDLERIHGTGPHASITQKDVLGFIAEQKLVPPPPSLAENVPMNKDQAMRQAIAASMSRSKREIPHYYLQHEINMTAALSWLEQKNASLPLNARILAPALLIKAIGLACSKFPEMNGFWVDGNFQPKSEVHIGVAIALRQGGLVAPALHEVNRKDINQVMAELLDLVARTRAGKIRSSEFMDPTITFTNLGDQGVVNVFGVIYPPQVALVGFGKILNKPYASGSMLGVAPLLSVTLSADHRASDGHRGARFLNQIAQYLENPPSLEGENHG